MATQDLITQAAEGNTLVTPDEDGVFTVQTHTGPERFCLIRPFSMNDIPKPPPLTARQQLKRKFYQFRDKYYANKLAGTTGKLACGVTWRLSLPPDNYKGHDKDRRLMLDFDDQRVGRGGVDAGGFYFTFCDFEQRYRDALKEHVRKMKLRNLVPADPGDPLGFYVMWECDAKRRQQKKAGAV